MTDRADAVTVRRHLSAAERAVYRFARRVPPDHDLVGRDANWVAKAIDAKREAHLTFRGSTGREVLAATPAPFPRDVLREAGITEHSTAAEVIAVTLERLRRAQRRLREEGVDVAITLIEGGAYMAAAGALIPGEPIEGEAT
jgi:hypothetical protein